MSIKRPRPRGGRAEAPAAAPITLRPEDPELEKWLAELDKLLDEMDQA